LSKQRQDPIDLRQHRSRTERNLVLAVVGAFVVLGSAIIAIVYGMPAVLSALLCLLPGTALFVGLWLLLNGLERLTRDRED